MSDSDKPAAPKPQVPNYMKFVLGGSAGMSASLVVQPLDLVKTRMQIEGLGGVKRRHNNSFDLVRSIITEDGPLAMYKGIGAALLRQATYTTARLGVYTYLNEKYKMTYPGNPGFLPQMVMGILAGAFGAFVGTPAEVALIRMTADGRLPAEERRNYTNVANALIRMTKEEGVLTLWRGCIPTVVRAMVVNVAQLATYSQVKNHFIKSYEMKEGMKLHFCSAMLSGIVTTVASAPVDILKTRIQNMKYIDGVPEYSGSFEVFVKILKQEGVFALWKGIMPCYFRLGPHTVLVLMFLEQYTRLYMKHVMGVSGGSSL